MTLQQDNAYDAAVHRYDRLDTMTDAEIEAWEKAEELKLPPSMRATEPVVRAYNRLNNHSILPSMPSLEERAALYRYISSTADGVQVSLCEAGSGVTDHFDENPKQYAVTLVSPEGGELTLYRAHPCAGGYHNCLASWAPGTR